MSERNLEEGILIDRGGFTGEEVHVRIGHLRNAVTLLGAVVLLLMAEIVVVILVPLIIVGYLGYLLVAGMVYVIRKITNRFKKGEIK